MIRNERQYRITKSQVAKFNQAIIVLQNRSDDVPDVHPTLLLAQERALASQLSDLVGQVEEYEAIRSGKRKVLNISSFDELPNALILGRIAAGLTQKQLADRIGIAEQQIQQYESTGYASASFTRIHTVIQAIGLHIREDVFLPSAELTKAKFFQRLESVGITKDLILNRILPRAIAECINTDKTNNDVGGAILKATSNIWRVFGLNPTEIFNDSPLRLNTMALGLPKYKLPSRVNGVKVSAFTIYAHYLSLLSLDATRHLIAKPVPRDPHVVRNAIVSEYGRLSFENVLRYVWGMGIPVLPIADSAGFHGANWRVDGRNVIVLAQQARYPARWLTDLLHETGHAGQNPQDKNRFIIEMNDILLDQSNEDEEVEARLFAEDVIFDGRSDEIATKCGKRAGSLEGLSKAVVQIAREEDVPVDALAYFLAFRLSEEGQDWWGGATNLQEKTVDPWSIARDLFLAHADISVLNVHDKFLLMQSLTELEK